jgi:molybdopterin synthase catalytic subunit
MEHVTSEAIVVSDLLSHVSAVERGAVVLFLGTVRRSAEDGPVRGIDYSAYVEMAKGEFGRIVQEAGLRWPEARFAAQHRIGHVPVGEPSIAVAAGAPHRAEAFAACRFVIEEAKKRLPVWKKELLDDGRARWREDRQRDSAPPRSPCS